MREVIRDKGRIEHMLSAIDLRCLSPSKAMNKSFAKLCVFARGFLVTESRVEAHGRTTF